MHKALLTMMTVAVSTIAGCGDDAGSDLKGGESAGSPVYVLSNEIYGADDSTSYLNVLRSLDVDAIDYDKAVEYSGGRATTATFNDWLFVAAPEAPVVTRFSVDDDGRLVKEDDISFANYGFTDLTIDEWSINFISATKAYLLNWDDGNTIVWNPTTMEITGEIEGTGLIREGLRLNGGTGIVRGNRLFRTFFWNDWEAYETSVEQYLAVYDIEANELLELIPEERCPGLGNRVSQDRAGNFYFSNWIWNVTETLIKDAKASCALRIEAGKDRFDADWVLHFPELTAGRQGAMLNILTDGRALLSVFHDERVTIDALTNPQELAGTDNWRIWNVDLEQKTAAPLEGIEWMAGAASNFDIDGRSFLFVPGAGWAFTRVHEIRNRQAEFAFEVRGWSFQFQKVR